MTRYIAAYDTELPGCVEACRRIVEAHRRHSMPATFFVVGKFLEEHRAEFREIFDDPLFEIASHSYSHQMFRDHPFCGAAPSPEKVREEIVRGKKVVEDVFERPCVGIRSGCGFVDGLRGAPDVLGYVREAGYQYVSTKLWGRDWSMPCPLYQPFRYEAEGFPEVWELPGHGWHENLLKNFNRWGPRRVTLWPPEIPEAVPADFIKTPEEETAINRIFLERAAEQDLAFVSLVWHPWSLFKFDPEMKMLDGTFELARQLRLRDGTYADLYQDCVQTLARKRQHGRDARTT